MMDETSLQKARKCLEDEGKTPLQMQNVRIIHLKVALEAILDHLEEQEDQAVVERLMAVEDALAPLIRQAQAITETSSAPTTGPASKPSEWFTEMRAVHTGNRLDAPAWLKQAIMAFSKFMPLRTGISFLDQTPTSLTLQLTWPSPIESGVTKAGPHGDVDREEYP